MPLYPYRCTQCGYKFEKIQSFSSEPEKECPKCHGLLERPLTAPALSFKGAGWYVNDYAPKSSGSSESTKSEGKSETKSETKGACGDSAGACATCPAATSAASS